MKLHILGVGTAVAIFTYNSCGVLENNGRYFLIDAGENKRVLNRLKKVKISVDKLEGAFISHAHSDHMPGIIHVIKAFLNCTNTLGKTFTIFASNLTMKKLKLLLISNNLDCNNLDKRIKLITIKNGEKVNIIGNNTLFFDTKPRKIEQYGFVMRYDNNKTFVFSGDEPLTSLTDKYYTNCTYLLHECFSAKLSSVLFRPHKYKHSTTDEVGLIAKRINPLNLIVWHSKDLDKFCHKLVFKKEISKHYFGNIIVANDYDVINLD